MTPKTRAPDLAYDTLADRWDEIIDRYDTERRVEVLIDELLGPGRIEGRTCLDGGCGLGFFAKALASRGGRVTALDIGPRLIEKLRAEHPELEAVTGDLCDLDASLGTRRFDIVVSSEAIEHTPDPERAVRNLCARVAPGGHLVLSCPNLRWRWSLTAAQALRVRKPYEGHENWVAPDALVGWIESAGLTIERREGIHLVPWQLVPKPLLRRLDQALRSRSYGVSVNLALLAIRSTP